MLLSIQDLKVSFRMGRGVVAEAVKGVSFDVPDHEKNLMPLILIIH